MSELTGKTVGRYQILERVGRGGMAEVYKAYQPALDRFVAVKVLNPFLFDDARSRDRFRREARAVAALRHPNIVQVFDIDTEDDIHFMVMEYIEGPSLKALLEERSQAGTTLDLDQIGAVVSAIGGALGHAHRQGLIHRDIKPHNIMFLPDGQPLLADFGIAQIIGAQVSASGLLAGTPAYMSPEQGRSEPLDPRTDIYTLGVVLYEMATGQLPFDADTPFAVILKHINEPVLPPRSVNPAVPPALERVILKAMAKTRAHRYQTADELVRATQDALDEARTVETRVPMPRAGGWVMPAPVAADPATAQLPLPRPLHMAPAPLTQDLGPLPASFEDTLHATLFDIGVAAYERGEWAQAGSLLAEVVRRRPDYARGGQPAAMLLAHAVGRRAEYTRIAPDAGPLPFDGMAQPAPPAPSTTATATLPVESAPASSSVTETLPVPVALGADVVAQLTGMISAPAPTEPPTIAAPQEAPAASFVPLAPAPARPTATHHPAPTRWLAPARRHPSRLLAVPALVICTLLGAYGWNSLGAAPAAPPVATPAPLTGPLSASIAPAAPQGDSRLAVPLSTPVLPARQVALARARITLVTQAGEADLLPAATADLHTALAGQARAARQARAHAALLARAGETLAPAAASAPAAAAEEADSAPAPLGGTPTAQRQ
jgi:tRNA A-37 threonylcarbamoyl transferase component Bud32